MTDKNCPQCGAEWYCSETAKVCPRCGGNLKEKLPTNGDRIRKMTDEELAEFLYKLDCEDNVDWWLDWLKTEVDDD